eukprot:Skav210023  [mRNA]  locus=scaffold1212:234165:238153:- [translate_table: standard]
MALSELKIGHPAPKLSKSRTAELFERNRWLTRSNSDHTQAVLMRLDGQHPLRMARMASTQFIDAQGKTATGEHRWIKTATNWVKYGVHRSPQDPPSSVAKTNRDCVPMYALHLHLHGKP